MRQGILILILMAFAARASTPSPIKASGRYLTDANGTPWLAIGDAPHNLFTGYSTLDAYTYLANRASNGVNIIWCEALTSTYISGNSDGSNLNGDKPFTTILSGSLYDLTSTAGASAYWTHVDNIIYAAGSNDIQVLLDSYETGGRTPEALANGTNRCRQFGQFLGNRYKNFTNIIWITGNDFQTWTTATNNLVITSIAKGIADNDANHLQTAELDFYISHSLQDSSFNPPITIDGVYSYYPTYAECWNAYNESTVMPTLFLEAHYEFENVSGELGTTLVIRKQGWWSVLAGCLAGHMYGSSYTWQPKFDVMTHLNSPGLTNVNYMKGFLRARKWYNLVPDIAHAFVTSGFGTYSTNSITSAVSTNMFLTAAKTGDGTLAIAYFPTNLTATVAMSQMAGTVTAQWYDPSANTFSTVSGSPFANTGTHNFQPTGNNAAGDGDWVLLLESQQPASGPTATFGVASGGTISVK